MIGILLLISLPSYSQLPDYVISNIVDELIVKDGLVYKVSLQDSVIQVLQESESKNRVIIGEYKLKEEEYKAIVERAKEREDLLTAQNKDLEKSNRRRNFGNALLKGGLVIETLAIVALIVVIILL